MISVSPSSVNNVPSVATNDEIPTTETTIPLKTPTSVATTSDTSSAGINANPASAFSL